MDFKPKKWDKEFKNNKKMLKQFNNQSVTFLNMQRLLTFFENESVSQINYQLLYGNLQLKYKILADECYLNDANSTQYMDYMYLSGMAGILARLFDNPEEQAKRHYTEAENAVHDFNFALFKLVALNQPLPKCIQTMEDSIYVLFLNGEFDKVDVLLPLLDNCFNRQERNKQWVSESFRKHMEAIIHRDEMGLKNALLERIREYRKAPVGYSTFIDIYSIAFMKMAKRYGMNCEIDVIEIPIIFFDEECCKLDKEKVKLPFFDEAIAALRKRGIDFEE